MGLSLRRESLTGEFPVGKFNIIRIHLETEDSETSCLPLIDRNILVLFDDKV